MNEQVVINAAMQVRYLRSVLRWLGDYGHNIGVGDDKTKAIIEPVCGSAVSGALDAQLFLSSCVIEMLPDIVTRANEKCHRDIEAAMKAIHAEVAPMLGPDVASRQGGG